LSSEGKADEELRKFREELMEDLRKRRQAFNEILELLRQAAEDLWQSRPQPSRRPPRLIGLPTQASTSYGADAPVGL